MKNKRMSFKRLLFTFMVMVCLCVPSSIVFAQTDKEMTQEADKGVPEVRFTGDVNGHEEFKFVPVARTTQEPTSKWSWSDGKYYVDGSSKSHTITADDLGGYSNSDKFYFRFNSSPIGNRYSISGYFG